MAAWIDSSEPRELADDPDDAEPGGHAGPDGQRAAGRDRAAVDRVGAQEARGDGGEHEDRLQALAEDEDRAVEHDRGVAEAMARRAGRSGSVVPPAACQLTTTIATADGEDDRGPDVEADRARAREAVRLVGAGGEGGGLVHGEKAIPSAALGLRSGRYHRLGVPK